MTAGPTQQISSRARWQAALPLCLLALALATASQRAALGADIYASRTADGSWRYATEQRDPTYQLLLRESPGANEPAPRPAAAAARALSRHQRAAALRPTIHRLAQRHGLSPALVEAIVAVESGFDPHAVSPKGARGAMQLLPATARAYGVDRAALLDDPERNIETGVLHLKGLLARHGGHAALALAAYNAGGGAVARHGQRIPPYAETMLYVPAVLAREAASTR